jgi:uncharacterized membrane protein
MKKPPVTVIIVSVIYLVTGVATLIFHSVEASRAPRLQSDVIWILLVCLLAVVAGAFMLRGNDWARWLALAWMTFHVVLSAFHTMQELAVHAVMLLLFAWLLFRPESRAWFHRFPPAAA